MSEDCSCNKNTVTIPVTGLKLSIPEQIFIEPDPNSGSFNVWESDWFNISASRAYDFTHNLNLQKPWLCKPRVIGRVKTASGGWKVGEILFCDGENYIGTAARQDMGWVISVDSNTAHVSFGNVENYLAINRAGGYGNIMPKTYVECKLVISYLPD